jgi:hypothetical protein
LFCTSRACAVSCAGERSFKGTNEKPDVYVDLDQAIEGGFSKTVSSMHNTPACSLCLLTALIMMGSVPSAAAIPLTPFRYEEQAQRHCPDDAVVWLDFRRGVYYSKRQKRYALGSSASFVCRGEARSSGYRRSVFGLR